MNKDILKGKWKQLVGKAKETWGDITDDELTQIEGESTKLSGLLQEKYGWQKDKAEAEIQKFVKKYENADSAHP